MGVIQIIRLGVLGATTLFSAIVLAITAHLISQTQQYLGVTVIFSALGVAVAVLSLVTLPVMLVVDLIRRGAFTSMIIVELVWLFILCILWVATAGETVSGYNLNFPFGCNSVDPIYNEMCQQTQAIEAFSFLNFVVLLLYVVFLSVMAVIAATRGQGVWLSSVKESFGSSAHPAQHPMAQYNTSVPLQPEVQPQYTSGLMQPGVTRSGSAVPV